MLCCTVLFCVDNIEVTPLSPPLSSSLPFEGRANMTAVARKRGWWDGVVPFDFTAAFSIGEYSHEYYSGRRMWRALSLAAPSLQLDPTIGSPLKPQPATGLRRAFYPWSVVPDRKLRVQDLQATHRDHYEGTAFDLTKGLAAGAFSSPNRWGAGPAERAIGADGAWERPISVYRVNYNHITQLRAWLPREVGACLWFGPHVPHGTVYVPMYVGAQMVPAAYSEGNMATYDRSGVAWWRHAFVSNWAQLKWSYIIKDIRAQQATLEGGFFAAQASAEANATAMVAAGHVAEARQLLAAGVSQGAADRTAMAWEAFADALVVKYKDGFVDVAPGVVAAVGKPVGYPSWWLHAVGFANFPAMSPAVCNTTAAYAKVEDKEAKEGAGERGEKERELAGLRDRVAELESRLLEMMESTTTQ